MRTAVALLAGLAGLAAASPCKRDAPPRSSSKGFNLIVNVTDPATDFDPPIQDNYIVSIHIGPPFALIGVKENTVNARIFYQNGTAEEASSGTSNVISDSGNFPSGFSLLPEEGTDGLTIGRLDAGFGTAGVLVSPTSAKYSVLEPQQYLACNTPVPYYNGQYFITIKNSKTGAVPEDCIPVTLIPQCTELNELPDTPDQYSSHEYALETPCYTDVASIDWSLY